MKCKEEENKEAKRKVREKIDTKNMIKLGESEHEKRDQNKIASE